MIPGTTASHTGPGVRWVIHNTAIAGQTSTGNAMYAGGKHVFATIGAGVISFDSLNMASGSTRYTDAQMEWGTNIVNAVPSISNSLYIYPNDSASVTAGPKVASSLGGSLTEASLSGSRAGVYAPHAGRWIIVGTNGTYTLSSNGTTWTSNTSSNQNMTVQLHSVAASPTCVITGGSTEFFRSTNATLSASAWSTISQTQGCRAVYYESSISTWMIGGGSGTYAYSTNDGVTWTSKTITGTTSNASGITFYRGHWFIGNSIGEIWRSNTSDPSGSWVKVFTTAAGVQIRVANPEGATNPILFTGSYTNGLINMSV